MIVFGWLGVKIGKRNALFVSLVLLAIAPISSWFVFDPAHPWRQLIFSVLLARMYHNRPSK
jgi:MFS family permease